MSKSAWFFPFLLALAGCSTGMFAGPDPELCESLNPAEPGQGPDIDLEARNTPDNPAFPYVECLAQSGVQHAQYWLGVFYLNGNGAAQDYALAAENFKKAAQTDSGMSSVYVPGVGGDPGMAMSYQARPRVEGLAAAQYELAKLYLDGRGVKYKPNRAIRYLERAAAQGHEDAAELLARVAPEGGA